MNQSTELSVGVGISKDHLDTCLYPGGEARRFTSDAEDHRAHVAWLIPHAIARVVFEATGAYHRAFERARPTVGAEPMALSALPTSLRGIAGRR